MWERKVKMDKLTLQEEAWKRGFERGYARGVLDQTAEAMSGTIEWHERHPDEDREHCYICQSLGERKYVIRPAVYKKKRRMYIVEDYDDDGNYAPNFVPDMNVLAWAHVMDPFSMRISFEVPEA